VDDTGARLAGKNGFCIPIGNKTTSLAFGHGPQESNLNFPIMLHSGHADYVISKAALNYMSRRCLARPGISHLAAQGGKSSLPISRLGRNASGGQDDFRNETGR
jgi:hypothetical protein